MADQEARDNCVNRLVNWKFGQALECATTRDCGFTADEVELIRSLSGLLGNSGWLSYRSCLAYVVEAAVGTLLPPGTEGDSGG